MQDKKELCIICAYRGTCQKQFTLTAGRHCPEFTRDLTLDIKKDDQTFSSCKQQTSQ